MGAGKSTVGRALARLLSWDFVDLDQKIERTAGVTIPEIFSAYGEPGFRQREYAALSVLATMPRAVISTGGGTFVQEKNRELIQRTGTAVWLDPSFDLLWARLSKSPKKRPLLGDREATHELWQTRRAAYEQALLRVGMESEQPPEEVAEAVVEELKEQPCVF